jgi:hypothetical protein
MANRSQPFRQHLVARALRGAVAAGVPHPTVEFHSPDGSKVVVSAGGRAAPSAAGAVGKATKLPAGPTKRGMRP